MNKHLVAIAIAIAAVISTTPLAAQATTQSFNPVSDGSIYTCGNCVGVSEGWGVLVNGYVQGLVKFSIDGLPAQIDKAILTFNPLSLPMWAKTIDIYGYDTSIGHLVREDGFAGTLIGTYDLSPDISFREDFSFDVTTFVAAAKGPFIAFNLRTTELAHFTSLEDNYGHPSQLWITSNATVPSVPEPSTYAMLGLGLGVLGFAARRRKST